MADKTINLNKTATGYNFTDSSGNVVTTTTVDSNGGVIVDIGNGFGGSAEITGLTLFDDVGGQKGNQNLGSWSTGNPSQQPSEVIRVTNNGTGIKINDTNNTAAEVDYFFSVNGTDGAATFSSDPELKVKRTTGGT